jgi:hypothetical protein
VRKPLISEHDKCVEPRTDSPVASAPERRRKIRNRPCKLIRSRPNAVDRCLAHGVEHRVALELLSILSSPPHFHSRATLSTPRGDGLHKG